MKQQGIVPKLAILAKDIKEKKYPDVIPVLKAGFHAHYEIEADFWWIHFIQQMPA